jgi:hypothetical protein
VVVSNTDPNLINETVSDTEPSIAIDPTIPDQIVITAFSGIWGANAPIWYSGDGGITWTKKFSIPAPPGIQSAVNGPFDQTVDYGRGSLMFGTFLSANPFDVYTASTIKPLKPAFWNWPLSGGITQRTNSYVIGFADQPWILVNPNPTIPSQDNVYVGYYDFLDLEARVAAAQGANPPSFSVDSRAGFVGCCVNPGHRLAGNKNNGYIYSIYQVYHAAGSGGSANVDYKLNRSTDGGVTWGVNGDPTGMIVANADSTQPTPKFGTVNALLGGVDHAAVDPTTGDVYITCMATETQ